MDVLVVRHAIALDREEAEERGVLDRDRPITSKGRSRMRQVARALARRSPELSAIISSPLRRAVETAELLSERYERLHPTASDALLPEARPSELAQLLADAGFTAAVAVVGHEPHLSTWVGWCLSGEARSLVELRKGGACLLRFDGTPGPAQARLLWLVTPAILRRP